MTQREPMKKNPQKALKTSLLVSWLLPLILYLLLRSHVSTDTAALAISGAVPALWVIMQMLRTRRIDWIGFFGIAGFGVAYLISLLLGGGSLPLKLYHPVIACLIGTVALVSVAVQKPLALVLIRSLRKSDPERFNIPTVRRKFMLVTSIFGILLIIDGIVHVIMALLLSTGMFLIWSRLVTLSVLVMLVVSVRYLLFQHKYLQ